MSPDRRSFIKSSVTSGAALLLAGSTAEAKEKQILLPPDFSVKIMATNWGFEGTNTQFCARVKQAGYDGIEIVWPAEDQRPELFAALKAQQLNHAFLVGAWGAEDYPALLKNFEKKVLHAAAPTP